MISILVTRPRPGSRPAPGVVEPLLTSVSSALARGRAELDAQGPPVEAVSLACAPGAGYIRPGTLAEVIDAHDASWRGMVTGWEITVEAGDGEPVCDVSISVERLA